MIDKMTKGSIYREICILSLKNIYVGKFTNLSGKIVDLVYNHDIDVGFIRGEYGWSGKKDLLFEENMYIVSKQEIRLNTFLRSRGLII